MQLAPLAALDSRAVAQVNYRTWALFAAAAILTGYSISILIQLLTPPVSRVSITSEAMVVLATVAGSLIIRSGRVRPGCAVVVGSVWLELHVATADFRAIPVTTGTVMPAVIVAAGLLLGRRWALAGGAVSSLTIPLAAALGAELAGSEPFAGQHELYRAAMTGIAFASIGAVTWLGVRAYDQVLHLARANEREFARLVDNAPDGIVLLGSGGVVAAMNPAAERLLDLGRGAGVGRDFDELVAAVAGPVTLPAPGSSGGSVITLSYRLRGAQVHAEVEVRTAELTDGTVGRQVTLRDITERRQMEERALQLGRIIDQARSEIYIFDPGEMRVRFASRGARDNLGYGSQVVGAPISDISPGLTHARLNWVLRGRTEQAHEPFRAFHRRRDGTVYPVELWLQAGSFDDRPGVLAFALDMSDRVAAEREHERLRAQLEQAQRAEAIGEMAGSVTHEFSNVLTTIGGYAEVLDEAVEGDEERGMVEGIRAAQQRAVALTRSLLSLVGRAVYKPQPLQVRELLGELTPVLERLLGERHRLVVESGEGPDTILADRAQIQQVVLNLVTNARDAMPRGGAVFIQVYGSATGKLVLEVRDTGVGMDEETRSRIFEPSFTTKQGGSGLGLATAHGIVTRAGGHFEVETAPNWGTRMRVHWPLASQAAHQVSAEDPAGAATRSGTILVVEDDAGMRGMIRMFLERAGYCVHLAESAEEALDKLDRESLAPDAMVTDIVLPGLSGVALAERAGQLVPGLRTLYMSGYLSKELEDGPDGEHSVLMKPFSRADLLRRLELLMRA